MGGGIYQTRDSAVPPNPDFLAYFIWLKKVTWGWRGKMLGDQSDGVVGNATGEDTSSGGKWGAGGE